MSEVDYFFTCGAARWLEFGRVFKFFEIVFVRAVIDIHLGLEAIAAFFAGFPVARVPFIEVRTAQCIAVMVAGTTVMGIGKQDVILMVVADPIAAALGFGQIFGFTTQSAARLFFPRLFSGLTALAQFFFQFLYLFVICKFDPVHG